MADCPYARCIQERKHIRRELLRWTKNMVFVVGLERVAEELMGRRRWKQYQDTLYSGTRSTTDTTTALSQHQQQQLQLQLQQLAQQAQQAKPGDPASQPLKASLANHIQDRAASTVNCNSSGTAAAAGDAVDEESGKPEEDGVARGAASSPRRPDETGGPEENGRLAEGARENGDVLPDRTLLHEKRSEDEEAEEQQLRVKKERLDVDSRLRLNDTDDKSNGKPEVNDAEGTKETKEETGTERIHITQGLLRVKKEEELQENCPSRPTSTPVSNSNNNNNNNNNNGPVVGESRSASTPPKAAFWRRISPPPEDWKPLDKCYFCLDGKLPNDEQPPLSPHSDSSNSSRSVESPMSAQVDPMAASVVAAALSGTYPTLLPQWCLPPREPPHLIAAAAAAAAQDSSGADQPLDLSAKPKNSQDNNISILEQQKLPIRMSAAIDPKAIFNSSCYRAKPRVTGPVTAGNASVVGTTGGGAGGRRTYTEDELQAALRDIQSGKLGTRRAAVLYGIPRSTLRNKVYKLAMERERDASLSGNSVTAASAAATNNNAHNNNNNNNNNSESASTGPNANTTRHNANAQVDELNSWPADLVKSEVDEKELSGAEEEKEVEKALRKPLLSLEDLVRFSSLEAAAAAGAGDSLRALLQRGQESTTVPSEWAAAFEHANIGPYIQKMLAAAAPFKGIETQDYRIPEIMRRLMCEDKKLSKEVNVNGDQVQHLQHSSLQHRLPQSGQRAPMTNDDFNPAIEEEASDSSQGRPILKIPSYKPATSAPGPSKNGEPAAAFVQSFAAAAAAAANAVAGSPGLLERASPAFSGTSSPTNSLVGKGMAAVNFRDVIAKSISVKFQEGQAPTGLPGQGVPTGQSMITESNPYKRGRFTPPQPAQQQGTTQSQSKSAAQAQQDKNQNKQNQGGKGTRPKRGKYRNYDRDSLVEAVRAVQRGEMSVHRAGSYYGVPHSTLEYKVKERHLMRPRKRDQKQSEDKSKDAAGTGATPLRTTAAGAASTPDKKPLLKPNQKPFTSGAVGAGGAVPGPNGLKMPPFMDGMPHLPFANPFNLWGPTPFMPAPFIPGGPNVPAMLPEHYFASQRMRGLQEQQRNPVVQRDGTPAEQAGSSNTRGATPLIKSPREMAESLYDGTAAANGSFLDNLIRSSLESGIPRDSNSNRPNSAQSQPENLGSKVLIDQLCRNSRLSRPMQQDSSEDEASNYNKRPPTVDLSPSPSGRAGGTDEGSDRGLTSPPTPLSLSRLSSSGREDVADSRSSREREVQNGGGSEKADDHQQESTSNKSKLNHYPDVQNLYAVSTDKKSACDSKLIVDHSSQKTQQQATAAGGGGSSGGNEQRNYNNGNNSDGQENCLTTSSSPSPQQQEQPTEESTVE